MCLDWSLSLIKILVLIFTVYYLCAMVNDKQFVYLCICVSMGLLQSGFFLNRVFSHMETHFTSFILGSLHVIRAFIHSVYFY